MQTTKNKYVMLIAGLLFIIALIIARIYDILLSAPDYDAGLMYGIVNLIFYLPIVLYCFIFYKKKKGFIAYFITIAFYLIMHTMSAVDLYQDSLRYMDGLEACVNSFFHFVPIVAKVLILFATFFKNKAMAIVTGVFSMWAWILSQIDIFTHVFTSLFTDTTPIYFVTLYSEFFMELAFVVFWSGVFLDEAFSKKATKIPNN